MKKGFDNRTGLMKPAWVMSPRRILFELPQATISRTIFLAAIKESDAANAVPPQFPTLGPEAYKL